MGCPAKKVTNGQSGSALMRNADHALSLIEAVVAAVDVPVMLKMRMGWDHGSLNAPELARRAEQAGVRMITVHGRTRCQFFDGEADWPFIARVKAAVSVPVIANGDAQSVRDVTDMLAASGADGAMIGRGACGQPWLPGRAAAARATGRDPGNPPLARQGTLVREHYDAMLKHYGREAGVRNARKHLGWYLESVLGPSAESLKPWRQKLCREDDPRAVHAHLAAFYDSQMQEAA
jgi:nifR3 family TIM-barrel protein